jgi:hypothetical protein
VITVRELERSDYQWRDVNGDGFEYAIKRVSYGDEFVKVNGECLRRPSAIYQKQNFGPELK